MDAVTLCEEVIAVFDADCASDAEAAAIAYAGQQESSYENACGELVSHRFVKVLSIFEIFENTIASGTEVFSRHLTPAEVESLSTPFDE